MARLAETAQGRRQSLGRARHAGRPHKKGRGNTAVSASLILGNALCSIHSSCLPTRMAAAASAVPLPYCETLLLGPALLSPTAAAWPTMPQHQQHNVPTPGPSLPDQQQQHSGNANHLPRGTRMLLPTSSEALAAHAWRLVESGEGRGPFCSPRDGCALRRVPEPVRLSAAQVGRVSVCRCVFVCVYMRQGNGNACACWESTRGPGPIPMAGKPPPLLLRTHLHSAGDSRAAPRSGPAGRVADGDGGAADVSDAAAASRGAFVGAAGGLAGGGGCLADAVGGGGAAGATAAAAACLAATTQQVRTCRRRHRQRSSTSIARSSRGPGDMQQAGRGSSRTGGGGR